jgi:hypothetical protein
MKCQRLFLLLFFGVFIFHLTKVCNVVNIQHFIDYVHVYHLRPSCWQKENPRHELRGGILWWGLFLFELGGKDSNPD